MPILRQDATQVTLFWRAPYGSFLRGEAHSDGHHDCPVEHTDDLKRGQQTPALANVDATPRFVANFS